MLAKMSKPRLVLCTRAIRGLATLPEIHPKLLAVRRKILLKLAKTGQLHASFSFWRRSRKQNWLQ